LIAYLLGSSSEEGLAWDLRSGERKSGPLSVLVSVLAVLRYNPLPSHLCSPDLRPKVQVLRQVNPAFHAFFERRQYPPVEE
jgi:hypothetical protein